MKAIVYYSNGSPDVLKCEEIERPTPSGHEVLIRVRAAAMNPLDCGELMGLPFLARVLFGLHAPTKMHPGRPGMDLAGHVETVGAKVTHFKAGDEVFGVCASDPKASGVKVWLHAQGAFADYVCAPEAFLVIKPPNLSFEQAAAVPVAALTALQGLRDQGHIQPGQHVLINGAAGGVGTFAVQIAKTFGARVTGICSKQNVELVRSCGADHVIDYAQQDFTDSTERYDLIFDCVANHSLMACKRILNAKGICVMVGEMTGRGGLGIMGRLTAAFALSFLTTNKFTTFLAKPKRDDLIFLQHLVETTTLNPVIDRCYDLEQVPIAFRYLQGKHARGKVVIKVA